MSLINKIKKKTGVSQEYIYKDLIVDKTKINLVFCEVLTSTLLINDFIIRSLIKLDRKKLKNVVNYLPDNNIKEISIDKIFYFLNNGFLIMIIKNKIYSIEVRSVVNRSISNVTSELSLTGPKDAFVENFNVNLGLIRRRIKTPNLYNYTLDIGRETKTKVGVLYIEGICKKNLVNKIIKKLKNIDIDGIIDANYLKKNLEYKKSVFPTLMLTERPDKCCMALLEGKIVIIVDCSPYCIILPNFFIDFFHTVDDYYQKNINTTIIRLIRVFAFFTAILTPAIYISVTTRNYDLVPLKLLFVLKAGRTFVPFPAFIEAILMIISFEILKESDLRMSNASSSVSILGGLILGDAAVSASIVSPIMIIVIAISSIAGLVFSSLELVNAIRIYKIIFLILATLMGVYGIIIASILLIYDLSHIKNYDIPYLTPFHPFDKHEINDSIYKFDEDKKYRKEVLSNNHVRGK